MPAGLRDASWAAAQAGFRPHENATVSLVGQGVAPPFPWGPSSLMCGNSTGSHKADPRRVTGGVTGVVLTSQMPVLDVGGPAKDRHLFKKFVSELQ